mmetsp:Transcript_35934/g.55196  ORF Transcript_35934/g.55196 Transcript_35934/m.55196 type:complete len:124 (-) Transcript_35934:387-758(-)
MHLEPEVAQNCLAELEDQKYGISLDLDNVACSKCGSTQVSMESILTSLRCRKPCNQYKVIKGEVVVRAVFPSMGEGLKVEIKRVQLLHPKMMRNDTQTLLSIDKQYKIIHQIDMCAFASEKDD